MNKIKTILIDDEEGALNTLRGMLYKFCPNVHIVAEATTPHDAVTKIKKYQPDLLLMDIEMPPFGTSFDIIKQVQDYEFGVILITAYPHYAIEAINILQPWAYLVKPFSVLKLQTALDVAQQKIEALATADETDTADTLIIETQKSTHLLKTSDILLCQSGGAEVEIFVAKQGGTEQIRTSKSLKDLEEELPKEHFFRTHHSFIINTQYIEKWVKTGRNGMIVMKNQMRVPVSVQKMHQFDEFLLKQRKFDRKG
ncbi:MAG: response regulator transcription factor [Saprospiraceae bacterium]|nr:response regulator transcription factor [Saprospiraceae bacterium]